MPGDEEAIQKHSRAPEQPRRVLISASAWIGPLAAVLAGGAFAAVLVVHLSGGGGFSFTWAESLGTRVALEIDGLGALYALLATGIAAVVLAYSWGYIPRHLHHERRSRDQSVRFYAWMTVFMGSMVGLVTAQDLLLLFLFWDATAVASYFLIAYDRHQRDARSAALTALLVTGVTAVLLLVAVVLLWSQTGTWSIDAAIRRMPEGTLLDVAAVLVAVPALAKSAQVPLHFWLARAMTAPTPVSAYLHSAALVAAGVFLLSRFHPLLERAGWILDALVAVGGLSILVGGLLALWADELKPLLAYSTISQYGYVVVLLGWGGQKGALAASFYVVAHGLAKSALFLTAGAVTEATGETRLSHLGGLARRLPWLAAGGGLAAASLAALPLTVGFFKDELLFKAAVEQSTPAAVAVVLAAGLTLAYAARFWAGIFLGAGEARVQRGVTALTVPVLVLGALGLVGGLVPGPVERLAEAAGRDTLDAPVSGSAAYHLDLRSQNVMALSAWALGALLYVARGQLAGLLEAVAGLGRRLGPARVFEVGLRLLNVLSDAAHRFEVRDLRTRVAAVLLPGGALVIAGLASLPVVEVYDLGTVEDDDVALIVVVVVVAAAALAATAFRDHLMLVLAVSASGLSLVAAYAAFGGPDVALIAAGVEIVFTLLFVGMFARLPREMLRREAATRPTRRRQRRNVAVAALSGLVAFAVVWAALSAPTARRTVAQEQIELRDEAHAKDVVTAILTDFRGLDTLVEISVVGVAFLGVVALLRRRWA